MLRSLRETVHILLTPHKVVLGRTVWPNNKSPLPTETIEVVKSPGDTPWRAALDALDRLLGEASASRRPIRPTRPIRLTLSHHFVRFAEVPWQPKILTAPLRAIQAEHRFRQLYGPAHAGWRTNVSESTYGAPALAAAVGEELLIALQQLAAKRKISFSEIKPWGIAPINTFRKKLRKDHNTSLVLAEEGKQVVLLFRGTELAGVAARRGIVESSDTLSLLVNQEAMALGLAGLQKNIFLARRDDNVAAVSDFVPLTSCK